MKIAKKLTDLIGHTPLLENRYTYRKHALEATLIAKVESFNPLSSVKDRVGFALIQDAEDTRPCQSGYDDHRAHQRKTRALGLRL